MKKLLLTAMAVMLAGCSLSSQLPKDEQPTTESPVKKAVKKEIKKIVPKKNVKTVKNGVTYYDGVLIVNKKIVLPSTYAPGENQTARAALERLIADGNSTGLQFVIRSGYRSYEEQQSLYNSYVARDGKEAADKYSAEPGHSEHQTGLTYDVGSQASANDFRISFGDTPEGKWLADNAHKYGFIIRYPEGKEDITGYQYEPWHIRYVGKQLAARLYSQQLTLEEYFNID